MTQFLVALGLCAALVGTVFAQSATTVFGFTFGAPIDRAIPECKDMFNPGPDYCSTLHPVPLGSDALRTYLKVPNQRDSLRIPLWVARDAVLYVGPGGVVDGLVIYTDGVPSQPSIIEAINNRFGPPQSLAVREARNAMGASWQVSVGKWEAEGLSIEHDCYRRDRCTVEVYTPAGLAAKKIRIEESKKKNAL